jgi:hypothetical protein
MTAISVENDELRKKLVRRTVITLIIVVLAFYLSTYIYMGTS